MNILFFEWKNFGKEDIIDTFKKLGHNIDCIETPLMRERKSDEFDALFNDAFSKVTYDLVFTFNYSPVISNNCNKIDVKYLAWVYDSPLVYLYSYTIINPCNYVFVFDSSIYNEFRKEGITTIHYTPLAVNTDRLDSKTPDTLAKAKYTSDISFVGSLYNEKHNLYEKFGSMPDYAKGYVDGIIAAQMKIQGYFFIEELLTDTIIQCMDEATGYQTTSDGVETPAYAYANYFIARKMAELERTNILSKVSAQYSTNLYTPNATPSLPNIHNMGSIDYYDDMPYIFKCSKINLNISLRSIKTGIPLRAMDIMGAGGFLLTNYQADFLHHFIPDEDYVFYESDDDLIAKCEYYLTHESERIRIANNGYHKVKASHTYKTRIQEMLDVIFN